MQNLKYIKNSELDLRMKSLARQERELLSAVLETIREIDNRKLFAEFGYPNLFLYLTDGIGYSAASAQRRIDGARLLNELPEVGNKIESGEIKLTQVSVLQKAVREMKRSRGIKIASSEKLELLETLSGKTHQETEKQVARFFDLPVVTTPREKVQADESVRLELTLTKEQAEKLKLAQALISHAIPTNDVATFIEYVCEKIIRQKSIARVPRVKKNTDNDMISKKDLTSTQKSGTETQNPDASNGYTLEVNTTQTHANKVDIISQQKTTQTQNFSARTKKLTIEKLKCCQYRDPQTQKQCGSKWFLQVDHRQSKWAGGTSDLQNTNLLCAFHNRKKYRAETGIRIK